MEEVGCGLPMITWEVFARVKDGKVRWLNRAWLMVQAWGGCTMAGYSLVIPISGIGDGYGKEIGCFGAGFNQWRG